MGIESFTIPGEVWISQVPAGCVGYWPVICERVEFRNTWRGGTPECQWTIVHRPGHTITVHGPSQA
jgi:hypothetical protein